MDQLGRIVGNSVNEITFRAPPDKRVNVGDILVAEAMTPSGNGDAGHEAFLLRVVNVAYGAESAGPEWVERTAGNMITLDAAGTGHELVDRERRLFKLGITTPLGIVRDGVFRKAKTLPPHFSRVRRANVSDFAFFEQYAGDVEVGFLRSGDDTIEFPVGIPGDRSFQYHVGVFATTGMGKSNLMKVLAGSCLSLGKYGLLIFDPHGEYYDGGGGGRSGLIHHPLAAKNLVVYSTRKLRGAYNKLTLSAHEIEISDLRNLFEFSQPQVDFMDAAKARYGKAWFVEVGEKNEPQLQGEVAGNFHEGTISVVKRKIRRLVKNGLVHRDAEVTVSSRIIRELRAGKVVLIDTGGLTESEELLVATVLARAVFEANRNSFGEPEFETFPPVLVTLEEAQRVLGKGTSGSANVFAQIAREGRKFKTGICAVTQQPKLLDTEVISQFNTLFILGLSDKRDRDILQDSAKQDITRLETEIQMLMPGEAIITSPYTPFAVPATIHLYETWLQSLPKAQVAPMRVVEVKEDFF
ncbi:MAG: ATP-binding protein [Euryarchaeota archaeon]|nr:ATP-binding protein [Euryarchaeota archaeon]